MSTSTPSGPAASPARRPVGVLDSGFGGLSVLRELRAALPYEDFIYIGDSAHCPYGPKPADAIRARVFALTDALLARRAKLIVIACNSATIAAVEAARANYPVHFVGMEPAVKPAVARTRTGCIAVLATEASVAGEKFHRLLDTHARGVRVITRPCPEFVELVETGDLDSPRAESVARGVLAPLLAEGVDTLVLGCTHFPFLRPLLERVAGPAVTLLDAGEPVARRVKSLLAQDEALAPGSTPGCIQILTTGDPARWNLILPRIAPEFPAASAL